MKFTSYWILNNFEKSTDLHEQVGVSLAYKAYSKFCERVQETPVSVMMFSNYVSHLVGCMRKAITKKGKHPKVFAGICQRYHREIPAMETTHQVAEFLKSSEEIQASLYVTDCSEQRVYCKLKQHNINITISRQEVELIVDGCKVDMDILHFPKTFEWSAPNFITFTRLLTRLKFCGGWKVNDTTVLLKRGSFSTVSTNDGLRGHHVSCHKIVNFGRQQMCYQCITVQPRKKLVKVVPDMDDNEKSPTSRKATEEKVDKCICTEDTLEISLCKAFPTLRTEMKSFINETITNSQKTPSGRRWSKNVIMVAMGLWLRSPQAYKDLMDTRVLVLPSVTLLRSYKNCSANSLRWDEIL